MRIAIVEDHATPRESLVHALSQVPHWQVLPPCKNEAEGSALLQTQQPDVLLVDLGLPLGNGLNLIHQAQQRFGGRCLSVVLCAHRTFDTVLTAIAAGALGYLEKDNRADTWPQQLQSMLAGESPMNADLAHEMLRALQDQLSPAQCKRQAQVLTLLQHAKTGLPFEQLPQALQLPAQQVGKLARQAYELLQDDPQTISERQMRVLHGMAQGLSQDACAQLMGISPDTVKTHRQRLYQKLGVNDKKHALRVAQQKGLL